METTNVKRKEKSIRNIREDKDLVDLILTTASEKEKNDAFTKLLNKYKYTILNNLRRLVRQEPIAQDLLFETFQKAYEKLDSYNGKQAFSTWLFRISHNHAIDYLRGQKENMDSIDEDKYKDNFDSYKKELASSCKTAEEIITQREKNEQLHTYVRMLKNEDYKKIIELRYFKEYAYDEIVNEMGKPLGSVKTILFRARKELRKMHKKTL